MADSSDILLTIAELALGFTGFTGMVVTFGQRASLVTVFFVETLLFSSLKTLIFALLPLAFFAFDIAATDVWRFSSGLFAVATIFGTVKSLRFAFQVGIFVKGKQDVPRLLVAGTNITVIVLMIMNAVYSGFAAIAWGVYLLGLLWSLALAGLQFGQLVIRWKSEG